MRIAMPRGDIRYERFLINNPDETRTDIDFDNVYFTVKKSPSDRVYLIKKSLRQGTITKLGLGDYQFKIEAKDTEKMKYGKYIFDIQLSYQDIVKETFSGEFELLYEVTFPDDDEEETENEV